MPSSTLDLSAGWISCAVVRGHERFVCELRDYVRHGIEAILSKGQTLAEG